MEISANALSRYQSVVRNMVPRIGGNRMVSAVSREDLLFIRKDLLTGQHSPGRGKSRLYWPRSTNGQLLHDYHVWHVSVRCR
jgi:hypothetical protein